MDGIGRLERALVRLELRPGQVVLNVSIEVAGHQCPMAAALQPNRILLSKIAASLVEKHRNGCRLRIALVIEPSIAKKRKIHFAVSVEIPRHQGIIGCPSAEG